MEGGTERRTRSASERARRPPPRYRRVTVADIERRTPRLVRVALVGEELEGLVVDQPAASVRLLIPPVATGQLEMPQWNGNEFLLADGSRPTIRTFTPRRYDPTVPRLDLEIVVHGEGAASGWAEAAGPGADAAVSGTGRGYAVDPDAPGFLLAGDETALPAIGQLLEELPSGTAVKVMVELAAPEARLELPAHPGSSVEWLDLPAGDEPGRVLVQAVRDAVIGDGTRVWVAGEAAAVQQLRRHLFQERGLERSRATVRGYWKHGRTGDTEGE